MQNKKLCGKIIQTLLGNKIGKIVELTPQNIIKNTYSSKGVRFDILVRDEAQRLYNVEMQIMKEQQGISKNLCWFLEIPVEYFHKLL